MTDHHNPIQSSKPEFTAADRRGISIEISKILASGRLTQGPWVEKFEKAFARYTGVRHAIATNSGTSALEILLRYFNVEAAEVIVPTNTFLATANAVILAGGRPVLADISPETLCITLNDIKKKRTSQTRGIIVVHIAGLICPEIDIIKQYCKEQGLFLIEDAAHAPGSSIRGKRAGSLSDAGAFSFYPTKPMTTGEGGMITTNDSSCDEYARSIRCHGIATGKDRTEKNGNLLIRLGNNWRMSEIQGVLGYFQIERLNKMIEKRQRIAGYYYQLLEGMEKVSFYKANVETKHSFYKFPVRLNPKFKQQKIIQQMKKNHGIGCGTIYYPPCHLQPFFREKYGYKPGDFPKAEKVLSRIISLPIHPGLSKKDVLRTTAALQTCLEE